MIISFSVTNFLSFNSRETLFLLANGDKNQRDYYIQKIDKYDILKMAGIFGANASGKTNLILALSKLREIVIKDDQKKEDEIDRTAFALEERTQKGNTVFEVSFFYKMKFEYRIEFNDNKIVEESLYFYDPKRAKVFSRAASENSVSSLEFGSKILFKALTENALNSYLLKNRSVLAAAGKIDSQIKELDYAREWFSFYLKPVFTSQNSLRNIALYILEKEPDIKPYILEQLKKADYNISEFDIKKREISPEFLKELKEKNKDLANSLSSQKKLIFTHSVNSGSEIKKFNLDEYYESSGTITYFAYAVIISFLKKNGGILIIDELESSLHPELLQYFLDSFMLNTDNSQLIFTSHYLPILEDQEDIRKDVVWFTNKREDGSTELYSLKDFNIRKELNFYRAYKVGKFSAKPILGSAILTRDQ